MTIQDRAGELGRLHDARELLTLVNVWDVASARVVAGVPGTTALATASHAIAESFGYEDGENIPVDLMIDTVGRIAASTRLPVTADLEAGYGHPGETIRRAISVGIVGANLEDQMRPLAGSVAAVEEAVRAGEAEGVPFVLNARTDAFVLAGDRPTADVTADAIERGRAFLDAGAACVFVPGRLDEETVRVLVDAFGLRRLSVIAFPGSVPLARLAELGVARVSCGPWPQRIALEAVADAAAQLMAGSLPGSGPA